MNRLIALSFAAVAALLPLQTFAAEPSAPQQKVQPQKKGKLVFVATTGLEDVGTLSSSFRHAKTAKESGYLEDVVWLAYGRAIVALDPTVKAVPEEVRKHAAEAQKAGVRLVACGNALEKYGIDPKNLQPRAEVTKNGVVELSRLVAEGYQVIRY